MGGRIPSGLRGEWHRMDLELRWRLRAQPEQLLKYLNFQKEFMYERGSSRHTWHPTLRAFRVASMQPGGCLDVQEHTRNARSRSLV